MQVSIDFQVVTSNSSVYFGNVTSTNRFILLNLIMFTLETLILFVSLLLATTKDHCRFISKESNCERQSKK